MAKFTVDLGNLPLTDEERNGIASAIHAAVIGHMATSANPGVHAATKTLTHAGMAFQPAPSSAKPARGGKIAAAKPASSGRAARKAG